MTQLEPVFTSFAADRSSRRRTHDQLHASLSSRGISPEVISMAMDPSKAADLRTYVADELQRIACLHHGNSGASVRFALGSDMHISVQKGGPPPTENGVPDEWLEQLRRGYTSSMAVRSNSGYSPSPAVTTFTTVERPSGGAGNDAYCPFSTPPEFRGFDASPIAGADVSSPNVLD